MTFNTNSFLLTSFAIFCFLIIKIDVIFFNSYCNKKNFFYNLIKNSSCFALEIILFLNNFLDSNFFLKKKIEIWLEY